MFRFPLYVKKERKDFDREAWQHLLELNPRPSNTEAWPMAGLAVTRADSHR